MLDESALEANLHALIVDMCRVMHDHGYETICVGAVMRLIGVGEERASRHDDEWIDLASYFKNSTASKFELSFFFLWQTVSPKSVKSQNQE